ncbi:MAG TPA: carboxypeptidase regulatory-like domain-containing protein [Gemmatimonadaceae bacterium]|nr:carboxypeptidase regulatory-like domain-containing protein [Gemmatimonadaceae bacterium]
MRKVLQAVLLLSAAQFAPLGAQQPPAPRHDIVQGRVVNDSGVPVRGADAIVTQISDAASQSAQTDARGAYRTDWPRGTGDYLVVVTANGYQRFAAHAARGADSVIVADARLARAVQQLPTVVSRATRPVPDRDPASFDAGGSSSSTNAQNADRRLAPDQAGDLAAIAGLMPGILSTAGGISVAGLAPSQNSITLGGLAFAGSSIPRDAITRVRVQASSYDPSIGWFSGALTAADLAIGDQFTNRSGHFTADAPALQYNDPISARLGQRFTNFNASLGGNGQLVDDRWAYNYGVQGGQKASALSAALTDAGSALLESAGVAPDSAARLLSVLARAHVPVSLSRIPSGVVDNDVSFIGRVDHAPYDWITLQYNPVSYGLQGYARWHRIDGQGLSPIATPAHSGSTTQQIGSLTGFYSALFSNAYLADVRSGVTIIHSAADPYLTLPDGRVIVASALPDSTGGLSTLAFGGNSGMTTTQRTVRWESLADLQLYPPGQTAHRVKVSADLRLDRYAQNLIGNRFGTFTFNSLADVAANQPSSFTRTLTAPQTSGGEWNAFAAIGDLWRVNPQWQLMYGVRADANAFTARPEANAALAAALHVRNDIAPNGAALSPRLGFTWQDGNGKILRGGVGQFRGLPDASLLSLPTATTGLAGGVLKISCIGPAVPLVDWSAFAASSTAIPSQCSSSSGVFTDASPNVQYVDPSFQPPRSWRSNLGYQSSVLRNVFTLEWVGSLNLNQPGTFDRNFSDATAFTLPVEQRPVFVAPSSIVPGSGQTSPTNARSSAQFGRVVDVVSDLRSASQQGILTVRPHLPGSWLPYFGDVVFGYMLSDIRAQQRGFDGASGTDPAVREWGRGDLDARHQFTVQLVYRPLGNQKIITYVVGRAQSGLPFTPLVGGDVNGDGLANDRAFIFRPAGADTTGRGIASLLAASPARVRDCLTAQLGHIAARNSCEGGWTETLNLGVRLSGQTLLHTPRMDVTLNLANPLGGVDQLLHGSNHLRGWGAPSTPDPTLLTVRGFDPRTNRFIYSVNPRFGSTSPALGALRAPFRVTLDVQFDLAPPMAKQQLDRWLRPGRAGHEGTRISAADLLRRYQRTVPDPYAELLSQSDSLLLSPETVTRLQAAQTAYRSRVDGLWRTLTTYLASLPDAYDADVVARHTDDVIDDVWEATRLAVRRDFDAILAPAQLSLLTGWSGVLYRSRDRVHFRLSPRGG